MKLTIRSGESIENALLYLEEYLRGYKDEYPLLKGNMNVYVTLEGFGHRVCSDNGKEYILGGDTPFDVEQGRMQEKHKKVLQAWREYVFKQSAAVSGINEAIASDVRYLATAAERGRKPENIQKRKQHFEEKNVELRKAEDFLAFVNMLNERVTANNVRWFYLKRTDKKSVYKYEITPHIIFENVCGENWHFVCYESRYNTVYGHLQKGLPFGCESEGGNDPDYT